MTNLDFRLLRLFVCTSFLLYFLYFFFPYLYEYLYEEHVLHYLFNWPISPVIDLPNELYYIFIVTKLIATIFVFFKHTYAKFCYAAIVIASIIGNLQIGMMLLTHAEILIYTTMNMLDGIILYMLFNDNIKNFMSNKKC
ncbi:hypothetical protein C4F51_05130 [Cellvibrio sp. KB43]|uniref:Uncharacterized protein n=1 Tax=Cellvibrio polysaccharolyticus TaxID=2082724 RepID=A0A928V5N4_9GAMM|nr:hypothetical protein [Cellvibrio polysaccharolyticus]